MVGLFSLHTTVEGHTNELQIQSIQHLSVTFRIFTSFLMEPNLSVFWTVFVVLIYVGWFVEFVEHPEWY